MQQPFLEMKNISKTFPGVKALDDVYFEIRPGEVHGLVGENGAGKSTLIKILSGFYQPDEGAEIIIEGNITRIAQVADAAKKGIAVIYQDFSLFPNLTVAENIMISQELEKNRTFIRWKEIEAKAAEALKVLGADISPSTTLEHLSIAKQQMVAIAGAIAQDAKMIIMDEPTSALSKGEVQKLFEIINTLKKKNIAILFIGHKLDEIFTICDRFTVLRDGQYVATCNKEEMDEPKLISMMVGRTVNIDKFTDSGATDEIILEVKNLSKAGNFKDINFKLKKGEVLGITGLVGAGRSELMQAIFGLNTPDEGEIVIKNKKVTINAPWDAKNAGIAYIPESRQTQGLILQKSVSDNIALPILNTLKNKVNLIDIKQQTKLAEEWIKKLDIRPPYTEQEAQKLSGGNQQKIVLAKWLATNPQIMIVDEPTNGVDIGAKREIHTILRNLAKDGAGVIVVSSELPEILTVSDRILVMRKGRIAGEFINDNVTQEMIMNKAVVN